ncbi:MAG: CHASE2 domain-containing protein [Stigonema ocellatum SAG 48.90 = DSM 106950]|nr:CHASE2 domain-containing protein [Stigonema ocellatum SAG 48.90 = DSM 106950]
MAKLVVLKLDGNLSDHGCRATLEIGDENARPEIEISGYLPASPDLATYLNQWQDKYRSLGISSRIRPQEIIYDGCINSGIEKCSRMAKLLSDRLQAWLESEEFRCINNTLREELNRNEPIRVLIRTDDSQLQSLPWHLWDFFNRYLLAEFALSATASEIPQTPPCKKSQVRILAILGNSTGIDVQLDRQVLESLPSSETVFLVEPQRNELNNYLWQQWDILFFAGHSETCDETGRIYINKTDSLTIDELKYGLRRAIALGLQLAIFNSCDGLGLARQLACLHIPQMIVMREPVPDNVAQEFLKHFLTNFSSGESLYLASRQAREKLQGLEDKFPNATWLPVIFQNPCVTPPTWKKLCSPKTQSKRNFLTVLVVSVLIAALVMGVRYLGMLQPWELQAYDHLMQLRPAEMPDQRLLIITVDEKDIGYQIGNRMKGRGSLSDQALAQLLQKLEKYQPRTIGIDIYRDEAVDPDYRDFLAPLYRNDNHLFVICKVIDAEYDPVGVPPPQEVSRKHLGFSDFLSDDDEILRRQLLNFKPPRSRCTADKALSLQLAINYLEAKGFKAKITQDHELQIGNAMFKRLKEHTSGYQRVDESGYQVLLNYRSLHPSAKIAYSVSLTDVLNDRVNFDPEFLKDRIVLIGVTAPSATDDWKTPYSASAPPNQKQIPGVFVQAQMVSHILSAVMDHRPLFWWWFGWIEAIWIWGWSLVGGIIAWRCSKPIYLGLAVATALLTLFGICFGIFLVAGWIPLVPPALVLMLTALAVIWRINRVNSFP